MTTSTLTLPTAGEFAPPFERYVALVREPDVRAALERQPDELTDLLRGVTESTAGARYAQGKWSIREVVGHVIDAERVFGYRALCVARGETISLPAFDENLYAQHGGSDNCPLPSLLQEFRVLRESHLLMFGHMPPDAVLRAGIANQHPVTARALAAIMVGHVRHHMAVLRDRYHV
jgi:hypothetical protein